MQRHMKKSIWFILALSTVFLLAACATTVDVEPAADNVSGDAASVIENDTPVPVQNSPAIEPEVEDVENNEGDSDGGETGAESPESAKVAPEPTETPEPVEAPETDTTAGVEAVELTDGQIEDTTIKTDVTLLGSDDRYERLKLVTAEWNTNWNRRIVDSSEILSGGPRRDGIPSLDDPSFISAGEASDWLAGNEPVISLEINGEARAYPLQILMWHEIANDVLGGVPVVVTFCPLCNSALVFDRRVNGEIFEFGTSGLLRNSDLIMYDRTTETLWQQFTGDAIVGDLVGRRLRFLASSLVSFADFTAAHPEGVILSRDTGFSRQYGLNPYTGYDTIGQNPFLFMGAEDGRLPAMERVVTVALDGLDVAYPLSILSEMGVINDIQGGQDLVVFHTGGTSSALGAEVIADAEDVGATGVFDPNLEGRKLTFVNENGIIVDLESSTMWNILGHAVEGPLSGARLEPVVHADHFWFSWAAFRPDTIIFQN